MRLAPALCCTAALLLVGFVLPLEAQRVTGRVVDPVTGTGVAQAIVEFFDGSDVLVRTALTDDQGRFGAELEPGGPYRIAVWALGYLPVVLESVVVPESGDLTLDDVRPEPAPLVADTVVAEGERSMTGRERLRRRQLLGRGTFLSGAVIERDGPSSLTLYVADAAGISTRHLGMSPGRARFNDVERARTEFIFRERSRSVVHPFPVLWSPEAREQCMQVFVNHWPMSSSGIRSLDEIPHRMIAAIEIYNTPEDVPDERIFGLDHHMAGCGVVNVWLWNSW